MPYAVRAQKCRNSEGKTGTHVVYRQDTGKAVSCHASESGAQAAMRARYANEKGEDISKEDAKLILKDQADMACSVCGVSKEVLEQVGDNLKYARKKSTYYKRNT